MAGECTESSIATVSATPNWWPDLRTNSLSSWSSNTNPWNPQNPNSNSSGEEDLSISNQSGLSMDSSRHLVDSSSANEFMGETASDSQLWSHVLLTVGSRGELNNNQEVGGNSTNLFASKSLSTGMFEPACSDYLKKMDNSWEFTNSPSFNNFDQKHFNGFSHGVIESERLTKLSNLVSNWSIAPPDSAGIINNHQFDLSHMKQTISNPTPFGGILNRNLGSFSCYGHDTKVKDEYQIGLNNSFVEENKYYYGTSEVPCSTSARSFSDVMNFSNFLSKPSVDIQGSKLMSRSLSDCKKQPSMSTSQTVTRNTVRGQGITSEGKKKRSDENAETALKKHKNDSSTVSSSKMQVPKVKLGEKITALQQIVSPFGKTDTASVLGEAIGYIKFLQEQVQLLSNPYMKSNTSKDPWVGLERKDRGDSLFDLQSRGLCLVPISCTPHACRENTGSDYWTPTYRGCLYR